MTAAVLTKTCGAHKGLGLAETNHATHPVFEELPNPSQAPRQRHSDCLVPPDFPCKVQVFGGCSIVLLRHRHPHVHLLFNHLSCKVLLVASKPSKPLKAHLCWLRLDVVVQHQHGAAGRPPRGAVPGLCGAQGGVQRQQEARVLRADAVQPGQQNPKTSTKTACGPVVIWVDWFEICLRVKRNHPRD